MFILSRGSAGSPELADGSWNSVLAFPDRLPLGGLESLAPSCWSLPTSLSPVKGWPFLFSLRIPNSGSPLLPTSELLFLFSASTNCVRRSKRLSMETLVAGVAADSWPPEPLDDGDVLSAELS